ncbi:MAG: hypothetical protein IPK15_04875 [Verrucomicrobia bacterium]|nr:hypothetical protein [Verrucomicrobiota bacterium]
MNRPVWQRWWFAAMAFVLVAGFLAWLLPGPQADLVLADGRQVSLLATTYGNIHRLTVASPVAKVIARLFGGGAARRFGYRTYDAYYSTNSSIAVWTVWLTDGSNRPPLRFNTVGIWTRVGACFSRERVNLHGRQATNRGRVEV